MTMPANLCDIPFPDDQIRSEPTTPGYWWWKRSADYEWEIVRLYEEGIVALMTNPRLVSVKYLGGKFYGPIKPTKYGI